MWKILNQKNSIKGATTILVVTLAISNVMGMLRDHYLAQKIPTSLLDTYYAAFRLPDLLFNVLILGAVSAALIPVISRFVAEENHAKASEVASNIMTIGSTIIFLSTIALFLLMPYLVPLLVPNFDLDKQRLTLDLSRIFLLSPIFFSFSYFFSSLLNSYKRFMISSLAPLVYNLSIILATIFLGDSFGVRGVAMGVVVGAFLHMMIQFFPLRSLGIRLKIVFDLGSREVKEVGRLMLPRSIGLGAAQIMLFSFTALASGLSGGSVAIFSLTDNIQTLPTVIFGNSVVSALFPTLSESVSLGRYKDFSKYLEKAIISILYFLIPASIGLILLRIQVVRLVLGSGHFGWEQTTVAAQTLGFFAISLQFSGLIPLFARAYYALKNTKTPTYFAVISVIISVVLGYIFRPYFGVAGLALAFSIGSCLNCLLLYSGLRKDLPDLSELKISNAINKILLGTVAMAVTLQLVKIAVGTIFDLNTFVEVAAQAVLSGAIAAAVYFAITTLLGFNEARLLGINKLIGYFTGGRNVNRQQ